MLGCRAAPATARPAPVAEAPSARKRLGRGSGSSGAQVLFVVVERRFCQTIVFGVREREAQRIALSARVPQRCRCSSGATEGHA
eukprot:7340265-Alexandrium_andersonii.AAC.1